MYDMIIVGAGTAGLTAGIYALRSGVKPLILECEAMGGQITLSPCVENYPGIAKTVSYTHLTLPTTPYV